MNEYSYNLDWIAFTLPFSPAGEGATLADHEQAVRNSIERGLGAHFTHMITDAAAFMLRGRAPYTMGWRNAEHGVVVWAAESTAHMTVEFSGKGCDFLRSSDAEFTLLEAVAGRLTRLDVALDILCAVDPIAFVESRVEGRFKTESIMNSSSGTTCYIGSMKSERYARIYRYKPPHPRSKLLRVEHVFRREQARAVGHTVLHFGLAAVMQACIDVFGWQHPIIPTISTQPVNLSAERPERGQGSTTRWLLTQVAPAFQRLVLDGTIADPETFLREFFLPQVTENPDD